MIILDTNVLSEVMKPAPSSRVVSWLGEHPTVRLFTTTITEAEILYGIELLARGRRRNALQAPAEAMFAEEFSDAFCPLIARRRARFVTGPWRAARWAGP
jgi:toxin FitB